MLEMTHEDWKCLMKFLQAANDAHKEIRKAYKAGKQQVTIKSPSIEAIAQMEIDPDLWLKIGNFIGGKLNKGEADDE